MGSDRDTTGSAWHMTEIRVARKILRMTVELHIRGYQRMRIVPGISPSGMHWRCSLTPIDNIADDHGALAKRADPELGAHYSDASGRDYFGWTDARHASPSKLADLFLERFPALARRGLGPDWGYAGWLQHVLALTYPSRLPVAYGDYVDSTMYLPTRGRGADVRVPLPPLPGESDRAMAARIANAGLRLSE